MELCIRCQRVATDLIHDDPNSHGNTGCGAMHPFIGAACVPVIHHARQDVLLCTQSHAHAKALTDDERLWNQALAKAAAAVESQLAPIPPEALAEHDHYWKYEIAKQAEAKDA